MHEAVCPTVTRDDRVETKPLGRGDHVPEMSRAVSGRVCRLATTGIYPETRHDVDGRQLFDSHQLT